MPTGKYEHKKGVKFTEERKKKISKSLLGRKGKLTEEGKKRLSEKHKGDKSNKWRGDKVGKQGMHFWVKKFKPKPESCEFCGRKVRLELANMKNHNYTRNPEDYKWLCYKCHKRWDIGDMTHCKRGHEYNEENTIRHKDGTKQCRRCRNEVVRKKRKENPEKYRKHERDNYYKKQLAKEFKIGEGKE